LCPSDLERYDRQLRLKGWDQRKLQASTVLVVGVGAIGCEAAKNLGLMGVGSLVLVDSDCVEVSNLSRQMLFTDRDVGRPKALVAKRRIRAMNPNVRMEAHHCRAQQIAQKTLEKADVICSCVDNWATRRWLNSLAVELRKPMVDGAMDGVYGNIQVIIPGETACVECHGDRLIPRDVQLAECTLKKRTPQDLATDLKKEGIDIDESFAAKLYEAGFKTIYDLKYATSEHTGRLRADDAQRVVDLQEKLMPPMPALQSVAAIVAGVVSHEVVKLLEENAIGRAQDGLMVYDATNETFSPVELERNRDCFVCGEYYGTRYLTLQVELSEKVEELKKRIAESFGYPDPEVQFKTRILRDGEVLSEADIKDGDLIHVHTSRRLSPLTLKLSAG